MSDIIIGVDLGGTQIRVARLDSQLNILAREAILTEAEHGPDHVIDRMIGLIKAMLPPPGTRVIGVGVSSPGPLNPITGMVIDPPNLPGWTEVPLVQRLRDALGLRVYIGNDANVAVLAEVARGAAQGCKHAIYLTLSTGIGGGVLVDGRLLLGQKGYAAELGHILMVVDGRAVTLEKLAAGLSLARQAREALEQGRESRLRDLCGGDLARIDSALIGQAAAEGDRLALEIVERAGYFIGVGIASYLHIFNPEIIVIGGGVSKLGDYLFEPMHRAIHENVISQGYLENLRIEKAILGDNVSVIGAAALVALEVS